MIFRLQSDRQRALSHADISIYPVDARGLIGGLSGPAGRPILTTMTQLAPSFDTSSIIAEQTGGRVFRNTNDLRAAMQRAVADADLTYVLGYYPQDDRFDGRFRKIEVKVRKNDLSVRHRRGYYAHPPKAVAGLGKDGLIDALHYPIEATGLGMTVTSSAAPNGDVTLASNEAERHEWRASVLRFIREHLDATDMFRLGPDDLAFGELLPAPRPPWSWRRAIRKSQAIQPS